MIQVDHSMRRCGDPAAVDDVSFHTGYGEVVGLPGRNGAVYNSGFALKPGNRVAAGRPDEVTTTEQANVPPARAPEGDYP